MVELPVEDVPLLELPAGAFEPFGWTAYHTAERLVPGGARTAWIMAFDESGEVIADHQDTRDDYHRVTGVAEHGGRLFAASPSHDGLLVLESPQPRLPGSPIPAPTESRAT